MKLPINTKALKIFVGGDCNFFNGDSNFNCEESVFYHKDPNTCSGFRHFCIGFVAFFFKSATSGIDFIGLCCISNFSF